MIKRPFNRLFIPNSARVVEKGACRDGYTEECMYNHKVKQGTIQIRSSVDQKLGLISTNHRWST